MIKLIKRTASIIGTGARAFVALVGIAGVSFAIANYAVTQGTGTNFGSVVVGAVHYAQQFVCDLTTPSQCAAVDSSGNVSTKDAAVLAAVQAAVPAGTNLIGKVGIDQTAGQNVVTGAGGTFPVTGTFWQATQPISAASLPLPSGAATSALQGTDPCVSNAKTTLPITLATAAVKVIAVGVSAKKIYVCQLNLNNNAADTVAVFEATTATVCVTSPVAVVGAGTSVATAGTGYNFAATGGISLGNGGAQVLQTATNANDLCIAQSAATQLSGSITYVTQ